MIERQASHLTHLVDDLLDVARITRGRVVLKRETLSLDSLVESALETVQPLLDARQPDGVGAPAAAKGVRRR